MYEFVLSNVTRIRTVSKMLILVFFSVGLVAQTFEITPRTSDKLKKLCKEAIGGDIIYLREGIYKKRFPKIKCSGDENAHIILSAYPNEKVIIKNKWQIQADYLTIKSLNFQGKNQSITYNEVINQWWNPKKKIRQIGLFIEGNHIVLKDNIIGNFPASGVKFKGNSDYITVDHNIIYNNAWWSTGGTGGLIIKNIHQKDSKKTTKVKITNNLLFANESRIFSHVFKKGFSKLVIDEGESFLIQQKDDARKKGATKGHYEGRYLVKNNLILFNGKGTSLNKANNIDLISNTLYCNGTTANSPNAAGVRGNHTNNDTFINNVVDPCTNGVALSVKGKNNKFANNFFISKQDEDIFSNPKNLDFSTKQFPNRTNKLLNSFANMIERYNIKIKPTNYIVNTKEQIKDIIARIPKKSSTKIIKENNKIIIKNIDNYGIKGLDNNFVLKLK